MARTKQAQKKREMPSPYLTSFVGDELGPGSSKYSAFVDGNNGFLYGIPAMARRVLKFHPNQRSFQEIGPILQPGNWPFTWRCGVLAQNGTIYCPPSAGIRGTHHCGFLKINTRNDVVEILNLPLPEVAEDLSWRSGALAKDDCLYFMPYNAQNILKIDPETETLSGIDIGEFATKEHWNFTGTVMGSDGCLYGIPCEANWVIKFDPFGVTTTVVGRAIADGEHFHYGNGVLGPDGHIYAMDSYSGDRVLKIDSTKNEWCWIENDLGVCDRGWGDPVVGVDSCIYWPPNEANDAMKFDPATQKPASLVGNMCDDGEYFLQYLGGALSNMDGVIYCVPYEADRILAFDPFREFSMTLEHNLYHFPNKLGCLFEGVGVAMTLEHTLYHFPEKVGGLFEKKTDDESFYENAVRKFGCKKVLSLLDKLLPFSNHVQSQRMADYFYENGTSTNRSVIKVQNKMRELTCPMFITAAACNACHLDVVYHLLRRDLQSFLELFQEGQRKKKKCKLNE